VLPSPTPSFTLRLAESGDFDAYMDAFETVAAEGRWLGAEAPVDREVRRRGFDQAIAGDGAVLYLADAGADGGVVGSIYGSLSRGVVDLGMFVADGYRGGGIGSALLEAVIEWARQHKAHKISLAAWPTNHPAIGLYALRLPRRGHPPPPAPAAQRRPVGLGGDGPRPRRGDSRRAGPGAAGASAHRAARRWDR
jgi:GNAT superfamily N-acetyltransferase